VTALLALLARIGRAFLAVVLDLWNGLKSGLRAMAGLDERRPVGNAAARPAELARTPRDPRQGLDPADPANAHMLGTCPVCGMDDPERFELGVATGTWDGWPAHDTCVAWLVSDEPEPAPRPAAGPASWSVTPGAGMRIFVTAKLAGSTHSALAVLKDADAAFPRTDLICWQQPAPDDLILLTGVPAASAPAVPPGAEAVAWIQVPPGCTQIYAGLIRCALPSSCQGCGDRPPA
jgi:hypothetical protein